MSAVGSRGSRKGCRKAIAVFLDRDGTINEDVGYLNNPQRLMPIEGALEAIGLLKRAGLKVVIVTNQSGLSRGLIGERDLRAIHERLMTMLSRRGVSIDGVYHCPHLPEEGCRCRKPKTGLVERAAEDLGIDPGSSYVVGDKVSDMELARNIGAKGVLVLTGYGRESLAELEEKGRPPHHVAMDLLEAARWIVRDLEGS